MRWVMLAIAIYVLTLVQTSLGGVLTLDVPGAGPVGPDLLAILAVCVAMEAPRRADVMLAAWLMGLAIDLTTGAGAEVSTAVGPMSIAYALGAGAIFAMREALFRKNVLTHCAMAMFFCIVTHGFWVTAQWVIALHSMTWRGYALMLTQAGLLSAYTAVLMPLGCLAFQHGGRRLIVGAPSRARQDRL